MTRNLDVISSNLVDGYRQSLTLVEHGQDALLVMPQTFSDGTLLSVLISTGGTVVSVTDRGITSDLLGIAGVDISRGAVARSWEAVLKSGRTLPAFGAEPWEITASGDAEDLSTLVQVVADTALRAEGLKVLAVPRRGGSYADSVVRRVLQHSLPVVPHAPMAGLHGSHRKVTCKIEIRNGVYLQALAGKDGDTRALAYDHAAALFGSSAAPVSNRLCVLQGKSWAKWQIDGLRDVARVSVDDELAGLLDEYRAFTSALPTKYAGGNQMLEPYLYKTPRITPG